MQVELSLSRLGPISVDEALCMAVRLSGEGIMQD